MNCEEARRHWELYYDSEGDCELYLQVNDHLADCSDCAKWFFQQAQFEELLTAKLVADEPTASLWQNVLTESGLVRSASSRSWAFFTPLLAIAAVLLVLTGVWHVRTDANGEHLASLVAVVHAQFAGHVTPVEFRSESDLEVERYLKHRVPFPVRCPPREDAGFAVRGGGVCTIGDDSAAYVVGQVDEQDVSIFILPQERLAHFAQERDILQREAIHHCRDGDFEMVLAKIDRNLVVVIGKSPPERLERVVRAYGTYPEVSNADSA